MRRRHFLIGAALAGCRFRPSAGYGSFAYVANSDGKALAVVDLGAFAVVRHVRLDDSPHLAVSTPAQPAVYVVTPASATIHEIRTETLRPGRRVRLAAAPTQVEPSGDGRALWALVPAANALVKLGLPSMNIELRVTLPAPPGYFDVSPTEDAAAVSMPGAGSVAFVDGGRVSAVVALGGEPGAVKFRTDGKLLMVADRAARQMAMVDAQRRQAAVRLPLGLRPDYLCVNSDGGQMFVSGPGMDAVVTVYPYQTEIGSTTLAGHAPGPLAASADPGYLFAVNRASGSVTILSIATQRVLAAVNVGREPCHVGITPDNEYALVLNRASGDMSVLHIPTLGRRRTKAAALFTQIPVGSAPVSATVRLV